MASRREQQYTAISTNSLRQYPGVSVSTCSSAHQAGDEHYRRLFNESRHAKGNSQAQAPVKPATVSLAIPPPPDYCILACIVLWFINPPFGVAAWCYSYVSSSAFKKGDYNEAEQRGRIAKALSGAGIIVTIVMVVVLLIVWACDAGFSY